MFLTPQRNNTMGESVVRWARTVLCFKSSIHIISNASPAQSEEGLLDTGIFELIIIDLSGVLFKSRRRYNFSDRALLRIWKNSEKLQSDFRRVAETTLTDCYSNG